MFCRDANLGSLANLGSKEVQCTQFWLISSKKQKKTELRRPLVFTTKSFIWLTLPNSIYIHLKEFVLGSCVTIQHENEIAAEKVTFRRDSRIPSAHTHTFKCIYACTCICTCCRVRTYIYMLSTCTIPRWVVQVAIIPIFRNSVAIANWVFARNSQPENMWMPALRESMESKWQHARLDRFGREWKGSLRLIKGTSIVRSLTNHTHLFRWWPVKVIIHDMSQALTDPVCSTRVETQAELQWKGETPNWQQNLSLCKQFFDWCCFYYRDFIRNSLEIPGIVQIGVLVKNQPPC